MNSGQKIKPPFFSEWLLKQVDYFNEKYSVSGDFEEIYKNIYKRDGAFKAGIWYRSQVFKTLPLFFSNYIYWNFVMFKNYIKLTMRNLSRSKVFSFINISGLSIGIACCLLIFAYISFELSYDRFHKNADDIYRIVVSGTISGREIVTAAIPDPVAPLMKSEFPEIIDYVRLSPKTKRSLSYNTAKFYESGILFADKKLFNVFSFKLISGNQENVLDGPYKVVISGEIANKYFGNEDPVGKILKMDNQSELTVTGVMENLPENTHLDFDIAVSLQTLEKIQPEKMNEFINFDIYTYLLLNQGTSISDFTTKLVPFKDKYFKDLMVKLNSDMKISLEKLPDIFLNSTADSDFSKSGDKMYIYAFCVIAFFILLMACINYMNLSTARSVKRSKEVGMRKVLGANRKQLMIQFFGETLIFTFIAVIIALIIIRVSLPLFNSLSGRSFSLSGIISFQFIIGLAATASFIGLCAGSYPALILSRFKPAVVLKSDKLKYAGSSVFRSVLVIVQFSISIVFIIVTLNIYKQIEFVKNKNLGFNKDQILVLTIDNNTAGKNIDALKSEFLSISGVENLSGTSSVPGEFMSATTFLPESREKNESILMRFFYSDYDFFKTYDIGITAGRGFSRDFSDETQNAVIINETALKKIGWDNPVGKTLEVMGQTVKIIGIVEDFHVKSLYNKIEPGLIFINPPAVRRLSFKLNTSNISNTMQIIEKKWKTLFPEFPFEYYFIDESFNNKYKAEQQRGSVIKTFTFLVIFIGCLGLFGLASFKTEQRTKEIGIRKAIGATNTSIVINLSGDFIKWVLISNFVAWPVAYFTINKWLQGFAYKTDISLDSFLYAAVSAILIAVLTVSFQTVKAAAANPVNALRHE